MNGQIYWQWNRMPYLEIGTLEYSEGSMSNPGGKVGATTGKRKSVPCLSVQGWLHMNQTSFSLLGVYLHCSLSCLLRYWGLLCEHRSLGWGLAFYFHLWRDFLLCVVISPPLGPVVTVSWLFESKLWMLCLFTLKIQILNLLSFMTLLPSLLSYFSLLFVP